MTVEDTLSHTQSKYDESSSTCLLMMMTKSTLEQRICSPDESVESRDLSL